VLRDPFFSRAVRRSGAGTVVSVTGELDVATAPALADTETLLAGAGARHTDRIALRCV
jgi:hypothetical protein